MSFISKILKLELFALFTITLLSCFAFYYQDSLPDSYFSISSKSNDLSFLSYYATSALRFIGYYLGPWTFIPFILFSLFYTFQFSKRELLFDSVNFFSLTIGCLLLSSFFSPEIVGGGTYYLIKKGLTPETLLGFGLFMVVGFLAGSFRSSFKEASIQFFVFLGRLPGTLWSYTYYLNPLLWARTYQNLKVGLLTKFQTQMPSALKGEKSNFKLKLKAPKLKEKVFAKKKTSESENFDEGPLTRHLDEKDLGPITFDSTEKKEKATRDEVLPLKKASVENSEYYGIVGAIAKKKNIATQRSPDTDYFQEIITRVEEKLAEFRIEGRIINILKGPVVDTFELELGSGVKVSKVLNHEKDLSMALLGAPIRIVYPMIGKSTMGIEVPRNPREYIYLDEVLNSEEYQSSKYKLPIAMGKDAFGDTFVVDLASMPHMLVAGATGAGKSVFINSLLVSLLVKRSPAQMKLILIDPKQLELALYQDLPHLIMPVITDAKTASISLLWACQEMERRYSILKELGVRNIDGFNEKLKKATPEMLAKIHRFYENEPDDHYELPYLVIIVDEFADLILTKAGKDIENNICRLAAKARAAGIHLVIATQRPSVDVITGLIKSNFPTRVGFRVTSAVDSRTILTTVGAEKLLGKGDALFRNGTDNIRVHSSFVDEEEIEVLTDKLSKMPRAYHEHALDFLENGGEEERDAYSFGSHLPPAEAGPGSDDDLYRSAVKVVLEHRTASASMLQRRLRIGYNRAANLVEQMESKGIVGPAEGSKRRKVLVGSDEF